MHRTLTVLVLALAAIPASALVQPTPAPQPQPPRPTPPRQVLAFYYPWYGTPDGPGGKSRGGAGKYVHWEGVDKAANTIASSTNYPINGAYDSWDPAVIDRHCKLARQAGIDGLIISWWSKGSFEDGATPAVLDGCAKNGLRAAVYYEQIAAPATAASVAAELTDIVKRFGSHPAYLTVSDGGTKRPVIFIYSRAVHQIDWKTWQAVVADLHNNLSPAPFLIGDSFDAKALDVFDGAHDYGPAGGAAAAMKKGQTAEAWAHRTMPWWVGEAHKHDKLACVTVFPGYDDTKIRKPGLRVDRDDGRFYDTLWKEARSADPDWVLVTSFNEWHEGSEIEPSQELGDAYIKATAKWAAQFKGDQGINEQAPRH